MTRKESFIKIDEVADAITMLGMAYKRICKSESLKKGMSRKTKKLADRITDEILRSETEKFRRVYDNVMQSYCWLWFREYLADSLEADESEIDESIENTKESFEDYIKYCILFEFQNTMP